MGYNKFKSFLANIQAIETAFDIMRQKREATDEEKEILRQYSGFGGMSYVYSLDDDKDETHEVQAALSRLRDILMRIADNQADKYKQLVKSIRNSTLTAFYTPQTFIRSLGDCIQHTLSSQGLQVNTLLEPSAGTGGFLHLLNDTIRKFAFEKDTVTGIVLHSLNPDTSVFVDGFESICSSSISDSKFDVIASNIPFGNIKVYDQSFLDRGGSFALSTKAIHNYFFVKAIDLLNEGGLLVFITSRGVADSPSNKFVRQFIVDNTNLITALRLPDNLFINTAGIEIGSDLFILQKHSNKAMLTSREQMFLDIFKENVPNSRDKTEYANRLLSRSQNTLCDKTEIAKNQYSKYVRKYKWQGTDADMLSALSSIVSDDLSRYFRKSLFLQQSPVVQAHSLFDLFDMSESQPEQVQPKAQYIIYTEPVKSWMIDGTLVEFNGQIGNIRFTRHAGFVSEVEFRPVQMHQLNIDRARDYFSVRSAYFNLSATEQKLRFEQPHLRNILNTVYDEYTEKWGKLHENDNLEFIHLDAVGNEVVGIELLRHNRIVKADIMNEPVAFAHVDESVSLKPLEALASSLNYYGQVRLNYICRVTALSESEIIEQLTGEIFFNPINGCWEEKGRFLAGNVIEKNKQICTLLSELPEDQKEWANRSVLALENVTPEVIPYEDLDFNLGERWVPCSVYERFASELFECEVSISYFDVNDTYIVSLHGYSSVAYRVYSVANLSGDALFVHALHDTVPEITKTITRNGNDVRVPDEEAIQEASNKIQEIRQKYNQWLDRQPVTVRDELVRLYNERFNCYVRPSYDGSAQTFPDLCFDKFDYKDLYQSQKDAIWMLKQNGGGVCWHDVGAGKTMIMCVAAYEMKRLGLVNKPLIIGLKANIHQIAQCFRQAYPNARILYPGKDDFKPAQRENIFSQIKNNNWDCIILTHEQFGKIPQSEQTQAAIIQEELNDVERSLSALEESGMQWRNKRMLNGLEKRKENLTVNLSKLQHSINEKKDNCIDFHSMGIDHIFVDEYHFFKNLMFQTRHTRVAGIGNNQGSQRAMNLLIAIRDIQMRTGKDLGATFLSGTVVVNALTELYVLFKYLRPNELSRQCVNCFDAWAAIFTQKSADYELSVTGSIRRKERFRTYIKVPELAAFLREITDYRTAEMMHLDIPDKNVRFLNSKPTLAQEEMINRLISFAKTGVWDDLGLDMPEPENLDKAKMLVATDIARKMALDMRMLGDKFTDDPQNKASQCAQQIYEYYCRFNEQKGTQFVFSDLSTYKPDEWNIYQDIADKLINVYGIPKDEIRFIQTVKTEVARDRLFNDMNSGKVRVLFGSTSMLGTGVNAQQRAVAVHHLDIPWRPADLQQRDGRAVRKGNGVKLWGNNTVDVIIYGTEKTLDAYKFNLLKNKQLFISQINNGTVAVRRMDEDSMDENNGMNFAEFVAVLSGNNDLLNKTKLDNKIMQLQKEQSMFNKERFKAEKTIAQHTEDIEKAQRFIAGVNADMEYFRQYSGSREVTIEGVQTFSQEETGKALHQISKRYRGNELKCIGNAMGLNLFVKSVFHWSGNFEHNSFYVEGKSGLKYRCGTTGALPLGFKQSAEYPFETLSRIGDLVARKEKEIERMKAEIPVLQGILSREWPKSEELSRLKTECSLLQKRIDESLKENEAVEEPKAA